MRPTGIEGGNSTFPPVLCSIPVDRYYYTKKGSRKQSRQRTSSGFVLQRSGKMLVNVAARDTNHHMNSKGYEPAVLDQTSSNYNAIRGREQMLIDYYGGAQSTGGTSGNAINGISATNAMRETYLSAAEGEFGLIE